MEVRIENLHFGYNRKREILHGINLTLPGGKFIAVLGPNGCGKTTTVKQINQILKAQQGSVYVDGRKVSEMAKALLRLNLSHLSQRLYNQLSGGQKQTVLIARALAQTPDIYLFDEPVSFLDVKNQLEIMSIGRELVDRDGKTVIMVLHDLNLALRFADHIVIMKEGNVFAQGTPAEVITEENILAVYGTDAEIKNGEYVITSL